MKNKGRSGNPWAICTAAGLKRGTAKFERCVMAVKSRRNPSINVVWPTMKDRARFAALQFAGVPEERAKYHAILDWSDLPAESKSALLKGWHMGEIGRTTRRYRDTTRRMPVLTNPTDGWVVTQDGETLKHFGPGVKGANAAFAWLHKRQGQSVDWSVQYSGYDMVNVEGGKVVYSYKQKGLRRLTNRRNGTKGAYPFKEKTEKYREYTPAQLLFAQRDAHRAAKAMKGHDVSAENWYMDDFYTISDEITRRRQSLPNKGKGMLKSLKNAAAGATKVVEAFLSGRKAREGSRPDYKPGARYETDGTSLVQWGSVIARRVNGSIEITDAGWRTKTTMAMLNAVLYRAAMNVSIYQKSGKWFLSTSDGVKPWNGKAVIKLEGGSVLANKTQRARRKGRERRHRKWYVSLFRVSQAYGGPEEGGWYYGVGEPMKWQSFSTRAQADKFREKYDAEVATREKGRYGTRRDRYAVQVGLGHPRPFPEYRPRYENNPKRTHKGDDKPGWVLQSANWIYAPGFLKWIMHGYATSSGKQKEKFAGFVRVTWGNTIPPAVSKGLAAGTIPYRVVGEHVHVDAPGSKGVKRNPLTASESRFALHSAARSYARGRSGKFSAPWSAFLMGKAQGRVGMVGWYGPKKTGKMVTRMSDRIDAGMAKYREAPSAEYSARMAALPNPISCLKNLHTARERAYAKKLIVRYWQSGKSAIAAGSKEKAAHAYGALAAIRRLAQFELPHARAVSTLASLRMELLRRSARDFARMRKGGR